MARILVIDDDSIIRDLIRIALEARKHTVFEAADGVEGLEIFAAQPVDLIITDLLMPEKEGLETIMEIQAEASNVKIIAITGGDPRQAAIYLEMASNLGADKILIKPFLPSALVAAVENLLKSSRR